MQSLILHFIFTHIQIPNIAERVVSVLPLSDLETHILDQGTHVHHVILFDRIFLLYKLIMKALESGVHSTFL